MKVTRVLLLLITVTSAFAATARAERLTFTTLAGSRGGGGAVDGIGAAARFRQPLGLATDREGNVYVADSGSNTIRKTTPDGVVTTLAGLAGATGSADGWGGAARFFYPTGIAAGTDGNLYVAEYWNHTIRKVTPGGMVTTFAGMSGQNEEKDGKGSAAHFSVPYAIAADTRGNLYVADLYGDSIRKVTRDAVVSTVAHITRPVAVAVDSRGIVYVADAEDGEVRTIDGSGKIATFATGFNHPQALATDSHDNVYVADGDAIREVTPAGIVSLFSNSVARAMAFDKAGTLYVAANEVIRRIAVTGADSILAGAPPETGISDGSGPEARFSSPGSIAVDGAGNVYVADALNTIRKIAPDGIVTSIATTGEGSLIGPIGGLAVDRQGTIYVGDEGNHRIVSVTPSGVATTVANLKSDAWPRSIAVDDTGNLYVADIGSETIQKITAGVATTIASGFNSLVAVAADDRGNVYAIDYYLGLIEKITNSGRTIIAGSGDGLDDSIDGTGAAASFALPRALAIDREGNLLVADYLGVRKVTPDGVVTTVTDPVGLNGTDAALVGISGIAIDRNNGAVYVTDANDSIRVARPALPDEATIDATSGTVGAVRQLDTLPNTATSWEWRIVRQPSGSTAALSSTSIRNPTFIPDAADLFVFQVTASDGVSTSVSTVSLTASAGRRRRASSDVP